MHPLQRLIPIALLLSFATVAEAGPPLICHPFDAGSAVVLPWGPGRDWNSPAPGYDVRRVTADLSRLLTADAPILARMENLRRASIYASQDRDVAFELLTALLGRALTAQASGSKDPMPLFDAAYAIEAFRQAGPLHRWNKTRGSEEWLSKELGTLTGQPFMQRALALAGENAQMKYAASLMEAGWSH